MDKNHIFIPFDQFNTVGGPTTFMHNLRCYLDVVQFGYLNDYRNAKAIFFPVSYDSNILDCVKRHNGIIIQRLDGIYYPSKHQDKYVELNRPIQEIYLNYADFVIFQSAYSKVQCFAMLGEKPTDQYTLIINGVNKEIFYPAFEQKKLGPKIKLVTTGNFRNLDMLEPVIKALDELKGKLSFELTVVGPVVNSELKILLERNYINYVGSKDLTEVATILRNSDIFIYSHLNPPCPNSVLEAISCGLPVVGFDSGSMAELLYFSKELLASVSDEIFQRYEDFDHRKLAEKILLAVEDYREYRQRSLENSYLYSFEECGRKYVKVFERFLAGSNSRSPILLGIVNGRGKTIGKMKNIGKRMLSGPQKKSCVSAAVPDSNNIFAQIETAVKAMSPEDSLRFLFDIDSKIYSLEGREAIRYGHGVHTKHKHIRYHDFFIENIPEGSRVLDIGCGNGALTFDVAAKVPGVLVYGIDIIEANIEKARMMFSRDNIRYVCGDALKDLPEETFDVIILSNVLEHIKKRVDFLKGLQCRYRPQKFLLRVPIFERDWRVPLKKELGIDYRLDDTHYIEYWQEEFFAEMRQAGLGIKHYVVKWGEIWAEVAPEG